MITAQRITQWLNATHQLQEISKEKLLKLANDYPYFSVAQCLYHISNNSEEEKWSEFIARYNFHPVLVYYLTNDADNTILAQEEDWENGTEELIMPYSAEDYFTASGVKVSNELPDIEKSAIEPVTDDNQSLMVVMSFTEWLKTISERSQKEKQEKESKRALKALWQKEKLAHAQEEESEEIPEKVFEMAVNSISNNEDIVSESLAEVLTKQQKFEKAIEMYKKLSLLNPEKSTYFAQKIEHIQKRN